MHILTESLIIYKDHLIPLGAFQQWVDKSKGREHTITEGVSPESGDSIEYENTVSWDDYYGTEPFYNELDSYIQNVPIDTHHVFMCAATDIAHYSLLMKDYKKNVINNENEMGFFDLSEAINHNKDCHKHAMECYRTIGLLIQKLQIFHEKLI